MLDDDVADDKGAAFVVQGDCKDFFMPNVASPEGAIVEEVSALQGSSFYFYSSLLTFETGKLQRLRSTLSRSSGVLAR